MFPVPAAGEHGADFPCCRSRHLGIILLVGVIVVDEAAVCAAVEPDAVENACTAAVATDDDDVAVFASGDVFNFCIAAAATTQNSSSCTG